MELSTYEIYFNLVKEYFEQRDFAKALEYLNKLLDEDYLEFLNQNLDKEEFAVLWSVKGTCQKQLGDYQGVLGSSENSIRLNPMDITAWWNKGDALRILGRFNEAIICCDKALEIDPTDTATLNVKGLALDSLGMYKEAIDCFRIALDLDPNNKAIQSNLRGSQNALENEKYEVNEVPDKLYCPKCSYENHINYNYCKSCGVSLEATKKDLKYKFNNKKPNIQELESNRDVKGLIRALDYPDIYVRRNAVKALGRLKNQKAIVPLRNALNDDDKLVRKHAENALSKFNIICKSCNFENDFYAIYCQECGDNLKQKDVDENLKNNICPNCGFEETENAKFCSDCGKEMINDVAGTNCDHKDKIDVNTGTEDEIAAIPNIGIIKAKKAIQIRNSKGGFNSIEDFCDSINIKPHVIQKIKSRIFCGPIDKPKTENTRGRIVDF